MSQACPPRALRRVLPAIATVSALTAPATAETPAQAWMSTSALRAFMLDRMVAGTYPDGVPWREHMRANGSTVLWEAQGQDLPGSWWFNAADELCFNYPGRQPGGGCFRYITKSRNCLEHFFRDTDADEWMTNGHLWRADEPSTCDETPSS